MPVERVAVADLGGEIDVVGLGRRNGGHSAVVVLGEAKASQRPVAAGVLRRLEEARAFVPDRFDTTRTTLAIFSTAGFAASALGVRRPGVPTCVSSGCRISMTVRSVARWRATRWSSRHVMPLHACASPYPWSRSAPFALVQSHKEVRQRGPLRTR